MPKFSIITPVYNAERYLRKCLDSIRAQSNPDWECICVDDGSSDSSYAILTEYSKTDLRFKVIRQNNAGPGVARNAALDIATGDWVLFVDSDDYVTASWLESAKSIIMTHQPDVLRMNFQFLKDGVATEPAVSCQADDVVVIRAKNIIKWSWNTYPNGGWSCINFIKREALFKAHVRFPDGISVKEDVIFFLSLAPKIQKVVQSKKGGYFYRLNQDSAWHRKRNVLDFLRFSTAIIALLEDQRRKLERICCYQKAKKTVGLVIWQDFLEWMEFRDNAELRNDTGLKEMLMSVIKEDILRIADVSERWRLGLWWLQCSHSMKMLYATWWMQKFCRNSLGWLRGY